MKSATLGTHSAVPAPRNRLTFHSISLKAKVWHPPDSKFGTAKKCVCLRPTPLQEVHELAWARQHHMTRGVCKRTLLLRTCYILAVKSQSWKRTAGIANSTSSLRSQVLYEHSCLYRPKKHGSRVFKKSSHHKENFMKYTLAAFLMQHLCL